MLWRNFTNLILKLFTTFFYYIMLFYMNKENLRLLVKLIYKTGIQCAFLSTLSFEQYDDYLQTWEQLYF